MTKYHSIATNGYSSRKEDNRAAELKILQKCGEIADLKSQVKFELLPSCVKKDGKKERAVTYTADFTYVENGELIVEDCKGFRTQQYIIRRKLMLFLLGITVLET